MADAKRHTQFLKIGLDEEDSDLLNRCADVEKLTRTEIIRRALREFAKRTLCDDQRVPDVEQRVAS